MLRSVETVIKYFGLLSILLTMSCTKEDMSECDHYLQFRYDYNLSSEDWFAQQVEEVKVYLFDKDGGYVQTITQTIPEIAQPGYKMQIPYEMTGYTAVVWAGRTGSYNIPNMNLGDNKDKLKLIYTPLNMISDKQIDNLWHNGPTTLLFPDSHGTIQNISLVRNTNDISVKLVNPNEESIIANHNVKITSANGSYQHNNRFMPDNQLVSYIPHTISNEKAQLRTLRLMADDQIKISITDKDNQPISIDGKTELDLVKYILKSKPAGMDDQEYLDRGYIWDISLSIKNHLAISITINGWVTWFDNIEI